MIDLLTANILDMFDVPGRKDLKTMKDVKMYNKVKDTGRQVTDLILKDMDISAYNDSIDEYNSDLVDIHRRNSEIASINLQSKLANIVNQGLQLSENTRQRKAAVNASTNAAGISGNTVKATLRSIEDAGARGAMNIANSFANVEQTFNLKQQNEQLSTGYRLKRKQGSAFNLGSALMLATPYLIEEQPSLFKDAATLGNTIRAGNINNITRGSEPIPTITAGPLKIRNNDYTYDFYTDVPLNRPIGQLPIGIDSYGSIRAKSSDFDTRLGSIVNNYIGYHGGGGTVYNNNTPQLNTSNDNYRTTTQPTSNLPNFSILGNRLNKYTNK